MTAPPQIPGLVVCPVIRAAMLVVSQCESMPGITARELLKQISTDFRLRAAHGLNPESDRAFSDAVTLIERILSATEKRKRKRYGEGTLRMFTITEGKRELPMIELTIAQLHALAMEHGGTYSQNFTLSTTLRTRGEEFAVFKFMYTPKES